MIDNIDGFGTQRKFNFKKSILGALLTIIALLFAYFVYEKVHEIKYNSALKKAGQSSEKLITALQSTNVVNSPNIQLSNMYLHFKDLNVIEASDKNTTIKDYYSLYAYISTDGLFQGNPMIVYIKNSYDDNILFKNIDRDVYILSSGKIEYLIAKSDRLNEFHRYSIQLGKSEDQYYLHGLVRNKEVMLNLALILKKSPSDEMIKKFESILKTVH